MTNETSTSEMCDTTSQSANPWLRILQDVTDLSVLGLVTVTVATRLGRFWWAADLLSHFAVYYVVLSLSVLAAALMMRRRCTAVIALALLVIHAWTVLPYFNPRNHTEAALFGPSIELAQVNVLHKNRDRASMIDFMRHCDADVMFVQELDPWWERVLRNTDTPYQVLIAQPEEGSFGLAMLVRDTFGADDRAEIESVRILAGDEGFGRPSIEATLLLDGRKVKILSIHPPPPVSDQMTALRDAILHRAKAWAETQIDPHVVIGDMNTTPWSYAFDILVGDGRLISSQTGYGNQGTWPATRSIPLLLPIDHCVFSKQWACVSRSIGPKTGSDHLPLEVTLRLAGGHRSPPAYQAGGQADKIDSGQADSAETGT